MKLGGFTLKKGKKKAIEASAGFTDCTPPTSQAPSKVFVTTFDSTAPVALTEDGKKPLVIPLLATNSWNEVPKHPKKGKIPESNGKLGNSTDEQAAAQILAETQARATTDVSHRDLVIPIERENKRLKLFQDRSNTQLQKTESKGPILQQNAVPGLDALEDVAEKYRHDVALRPEAPDVHSDVYESVPVEAFGAALLRGMGWTGDVESDDMGTTLQPRHKLLGLGAKKRPTLPGEEKKQKRKKQVIEVRNDKHSDRHGTRSPDRDRRRHSDRPKRSRSRERRHEGERERRREKHSRRHE